MTRIFANTADLANAAGSTLGTSPWLLVDQRMIDAFAAATGDHQWIHVDPDRCHQELGHGTIAHGYLILSLAARFAGEIYQVGQIARVINYGLNRVRFISIVPAGSHIRARFDMISAENHKDGLKIENEVTVEVRGPDEPSSTARPAMIARTLALFISQPK